MQYKDISLNVGRAIMAEMPGKFKSFRTVVADSGEKPQLVIRMAGTQTIMLSVYTDKAVIGADAEAFKLCTEAINVLVDPLTPIEEAIQTIDLQTTPDLASDPDRNSWQAWCYLNVNHLYTGG